jgi:D-tyrosyl-tRNA(Tyr) deacylase
MRIVIQRVKEACVHVDGVCKGKIGKGLLLFIGIGREDSENTIDMFVDKIIKMRIFADEQGKTNLSLGDVDGEILAVSQFTLYADCRKGNRPNFLFAAEPSKAESLYQYFLKACKTRIGKVESGEFGADMQVQLINDGPFTIVLDENTISKEKNKGM